MRPTHFTWMHNEFAITIYSDGNINFLKNGNPVPKEELGDWPASGFCAGISEMLKHTNQELECLRDQHDNKEELNNLIDQVKELKCELQSLKEEKTNLTRKVMYVGHSKKGMFLAGLTCGRNEKAK